jgi:hypothetical protein
MKKRTVLRMVPVAVIGTLVSLSSGCASPPAASHSNDATPTTPVAVSSAQATPEATAGQQCVLPQASTNDDGSVTYSYPQEGGDPVTVLYPPPDFDPLTASNAELRRYALPVRPRSEARQKKWKRTIVPMARNSFAKPPGPLCAVTGEYAG